MNMLGVVLVLVGACFYGVLSTFVSLAYKAGFTVNEVVGSQMLFACLITWIAAFLFRGKGASKKDWMQLLGVGISTGFTGIFYYASLQYVSASIAIVLLFQFTWMGILIDYVITRSAPGKDKLIAVAFLFVGTVLAAGIFTSEQYLSVMGVTLGLLSALSYAFFIFFSGRVSLQVHSSTRSAIIMTGSFLLAMIVYPPTFLINGALFNGLFFYAAFLALFVVISTVFINMGAPKISAGLAFILSSAELPMAVFMSRFVLLETIHWVQWTGVLIIMLGIAFPEIYRRSSRAKMIVNE